MSKQPVSGQQASGPAAVTLTPADPVSRTIAANEQHAFELAVEPGQAVKVTVDQAGADVTLTLDELARVFQRMAEFDRAIETFRAAGARKDEAIALETAIDDISRQLTILDGRIRAANPRYAAITHPTPLSLAETQQLLDAETVLLAFFIGSQSSWGWAITSTSVRGFALPAAATIEERARKVYADLTVRQRRERSMTGTRAPRSTRR